MRIHRLTVSAFGPFAGTEEVDFDRLSGHGLFLLNGATGAGKTSVLDAICFALYGSVPGARQEGKRLRSDHAEPTLEPAVTCEFSAQGRHFEVTRSPAWDKPSARGKNGFTTQQAKTLLREKVGGAWTEKSGRNDEAGAEITALLGMDRDQFTRVVMLPQGDFAAFLRSKATDRLELLQKLFGTQRFEAVEQELVHQAQAARNDVARLNGELDLLASRAWSEASAVGIDTSSAPPPENATARLGWLHAAVAERATALSGVAEEADASSRIKAGQLETEAARTDRHRRLAAAAARKATAEASLALLQDQAARLERHRQAEVLGGHLQAVDSSEAQLRHATGAMESAFTLLRMAAEEDTELSDAGTWTADAPDAAAELSRLRSLLAVVEGRLPDEERLRTLSVRSVALKNRQAELAAEAAELSTLLGSLRTEQAGLSGVLEPLEEAASAAVLHSKEATAAEELLDVVRRYGSAVEAKGLAKERHEEFRGVLLEKKSRWLDLREERLANAAAELAAGLAEGKPCAVCGSLTHPSPAEAAASALGLSQAEEDAHQAVEAAETRLAGLATNLGEASQLVAVLAGQGGNTPEAEAVRAADKARRAAVASQDAADKVAAIRGQLESLEARMAATESARTKAESERAQAASTLSEVLDQMASLDQALAGLRSGHGSLTHRLRSLQDAARTLEKAVDAQVQLEKAKARAADARRQLELALPETGFSSAEEARSQLLPGGEAASLQAEVREGYDEQARIAELFASEDIVLAAKEQAAGIVGDGARLAELREEAEQAEQGAREARLAAGLALRSLESLMAIQRQYEDLAHSGRGPRERAELLTSLAETATGRGDNSYRMSLNSYVLAARLEQVALAASERLVAMSDARYLLQHTDAKAARGAKSGLGLEVVDQWTGHRRDTSTLSGGESFMASLSLALGLADVVQQESGGIQIETLFVDEGFGSLDEQSLEQVMDALEGLRDGGRVVGLVSHVAEMKQRIGTQLQVVKGRNGSTLRISDAVEPP
ncbi:SMC family ATPase [Arthrobacter sp. CDRTa11]|uniref:AAA family ATPase n=1 Tax=Arthrobacter sp. CDRTa11 TaxID=2651199 RepID=UPI002265DF31|nr:SMC family ATPase [Arthrobacter sp. CDRTa11]UZX03791.1 SMC family ATPase [Arthrobacter sp. CDRTa11]